MRIRPVEPKDAAQIRAIAEHMEIQKSMQLSRVDFINAEKLLGELTELDHMLVIESETPPAEICAAILLRVDRQIYLRSVAFIEVMVGTKWQSQGIGRALMQAALELADNELMIERVEVEIAADNLNALKLCKSLGFKVEGTGRMWAIADDGKCIDAFLLAKCRS